MEEGEQQWKGVKSAIEDPEEARVIYCALDSFVSVAPIAPALPLPLKPVQTLATHGFCLFLFPEKGKVLLGFRHSATCMVMAGHHARQIRFCSP